MTTELTVLALAALLMIGQIAIVGALTTRDLGSRYNASPRDRAPSRERSVMLGRMQRAQANHAEGLILFAIAALVVTLSGAASPLTAAAAWIYLGARLLYVPAYAFGWVPWRSAIWALGFAATVTMILASLV